MIGIVQVSFRVRVHCLGSEQGPHCRGCLQSDHGGGTSNQSNSCVLPGRMGTLSM